MSEFRHLSIGQRIRATSRPPHPATVVGVIRNIDGAGSNEVAVELETDDGGHAVIFQRLDDRVEVLP